MATPFTRPPRFYGQRILARTKAFLISQTIKCGQIFWPVSDWIARSSAEHNTYWFHFWKSPSCLTGIKIFFTCSFNFSFAVAGIPLTASILTTGVVCTFYTSLVSKHLTTHVISSWHRACNRPLPSSLVPFFQSESKCETILMKMTLIYIKKENETACRTHFHT